MQRVGLSLWMARMVSPLCCSRFPGGLVKSLSHLGELAARAGHVPPADERIQPLMATLADVGESLVDVARFGYAGVTVLHIAAPYLGGVVAQRAAEDGVHTRIIPTDPTSIQPISEFLWLGI